VSRQLPPTLSIRSAGITASSSDAAPRVRGRVLRMTDETEDETALMILVLCARHLLFFQEPPLRPDGLKGLVGAHGLAALAALFAESPSAQVRQGGHHLQRLPPPARAAYGRAVAGLPAVLGAPAGRLALLRAARRAGLDLLASPETPSSSNSPGAQALLKDAVLILSAGTERPESRRSVQVRVPPLVSRAYRLMSTGGALSLVSDRRRILKAVDCSPPQGGARLHTDGTGRSGRERGRGACDVVDV